MFYFLNKYLDQKGIWTHAAPKMSLPQNKKLFLRTKNVF